MMNIQRFQTGALRFQLLFAGSFMFLLPFEQAIIPVPGYYFAAGLESMLSRLGQWLWGSSFRAALISDGQGLYLLTALLLFLSILTLIIWTIFKPQMTKIRWNRYFIHLAMRLYLSMHLLNYGFSKLFKVQFFMPEPNTLYTPVGELSHDLLFWTTMGAAYEYTVFSGWVEIIPAFLLLFRKTYIPGALMATAVLLNVLMLNLCFDISVKLFSAFLFFLTICLVSPHIKTILQFLNFQPVQLDNGWSIQTTPKNKWFSILKFLIILLLIVNSIMPYWKTGNFNDDKADRPLLHGAYEVDNFVFRQDTLMACRADKVRWKRIFIHRRGYFIIQNMQDKMKDFKLRIIPDKQLFLLTDYQQRTDTLNYTYHPQENRLTLKGHWYSHSIEVQSKVLDYKQLPLLNPDFHWTVENIGGGK